jgi:hypothetical protein
VALVDVNVEEGQPHAGDLGEGVAELVRRDLTEGELW